MNNYEQTFTTPICEVRCGLNSSYNVLKSNSKNYDNGCSVVITSKCHVIEVVTFKIQNPLYNGALLCDSFGWMFRIKKVSNELENINLYCEVVPKVLSLSISPCSGESLDAIEVENNEWKLHVGTEDRDVLERRVTNNDWYPCRLKYTFENTSESATSRNEAGFKTIIPMLEKGERICFQYISAYERNTIGANNSWLAVDALKSNLEKWIGLPNNEEAP